MNKLREKSNKTISKLSFKLTRWVGTPQSIVVHTGVFGGAFSLAFFGVQIDSILLVLTTLVSLEAIYLALFIQMTVNRSMESLEDVEESIDEIQEDVEDIEQDVDRIQEEDQKEEKEEEIQELQEKKTFEKIESQLSTLSNNMEIIQKEIRSLQHK